MKKAKLIVYGETHEVEIEDKETVLDAAIKDGIDAPYSCMAGTCNSCQATLKSGTIDMLECDALTDEEVAEGEILTCQAIPTSDEIVVEWPD